MVVQKKNNDRISAKKVCRYSIIFNNIFPFLRYWVNKLDPVKIEIIVQIEFVF